MRHRTGSQRLAVVLPQHPDEHSPQRLAVVLPKHPDEHSPQRPILLAVDQEFAVGPGLWVRRQLRLQRDADGHDDNSTEDHHSTS
jgi:hypothetical protein